MASSDELFGQSECPILIFTYGNYTHSINNNNTEIKITVNRNNRRALTKEAKAFGLVTDPSISLYNYMGKIPVYT